MIQLPQIDFVPLLPVAGLALIAIVCVIALLISALLRSRLALLLAVVVGVVRHWRMRSRCHMLVPLGVVLIAGGVVVLWLLQRNPELMSLARDVVPRKASQVTQQPLELPAPNSSIVINQPHDSSATTPRRTRTIVSNEAEDRWGF
jgi:hypothetical protein